MKDLLIKGLLVCLMAIPVMPSLAQKNQSDKFGKVSIDELRKETYEPDPAAHAVVLFDKGHLNGQTGEFQRHLRLKILTSAGLSHSNFQLRTPTKSNIHGITYNLVDGEIHKTELTRDNIYYEEIIEGVDTYKVFFANVKVGSVIELRYSFNGLPNEWRFQERIPVVYSELILEPTRYIVFKKTMYGPPLVKSNGSFKWVAENVPAFREEPYMFHYSNYLTRFKFDIEKVYLQNVYLELSTSWEKVGERLWEHANFGGLIRSSSFLNDKAKELKAMEGTTESKIGEAYRYIQENIKWNGASSALATSSYRKNFISNHQGNSAEINLLMTALLRKAGLQAYPAILSTRENGLLNPASASLSSVNYVVAFVRDSTTEMFVDATSKNLVPGILPVRCRNTTAFVIDSPAGWWVDTSRGKWNSRKQFIMISSNPGEQVTAAITNTYEDYDYLEWADAFDRAGSEQQFVNSLISQSRDLEIQECKVSYQKEKLRATEQIQVDLSGSEYVHQLDNEIIINPFILNDIDNPFKSETRQHPVDFTTPRMRSIIIAMRIPENYALRNQPDTLLISPDSGGARFVYLSAVVNNFFNIRCVLQIERQVFLETEYESIRKFFSAVNRKLSEAIQLDKKT